MFIYQKILLYEVQNKITEIKENIYLKFYLFEEGFGNIKLNKKVFSLLCPCLICLSEYDIIEFTGDARIHSLYFHPTIINCTFDSETIRKNLSELKKGQELDIYWVLPFLQNRGPISVGPATSKRITKIISTIIKILTEKKGTYWVCRSRSFLYELLNLIAHIHATPDRIEQDAINKFDLEIQNIIDYLNTNYHRKISIAKITELFAINRTTLSKKFKEATGMTIINYLSKTRIHMACALLRDTNLKIYEIMYRVGFEDITHFGRTFRQQMGKSPTEYRTIAYEE